MAGQGAPTIGEVFHRRLVEIRKAVGYPSQAALADRLDADGVHLGATAVARIETGQRGVKLDEAIALGAVLGVSPSWLLTPDAARDMVAVTPELTAQAWVVRGWLAGEPLGNRRVDERSLLAVLPEEERAVHRCPALASLRTAVSSLARATLDGREDRMRRELDSIAREVDRLREELDDEGGE